MNQEIIQLTQVIKKYDSLLRRFARRLLASEFLAANVVQQVLEEQYTLHGLQPSPQLRDVLKNEVIKKVAAIQKAKAIAASYEANFLNKKDHTSLNP